MRALVIEEYGPIASHRFQTLPDPSFAADEVLIDVKAIGLNFPDALMLQGKYQKKPQTPFVPGRDAAGVVRAVGSGVSRFKPGDRVICQVLTGAFAEAVAAPQKRCFHMVDGVDFESAAAMITVFNTAYVAVHLRAKAQAGQTAIVTGAAGGVGLAALQMLKALGARTIAIVSSEQKAALARENGADHVILSNGSDVKERIHREVMTRTDNHGADLVFDTVGGDMFANTLRVLGFDGKLVIIGFASGDIPSAKANYLLYKNLAVIGAPLDIQFDHEYDKMVEGVRLTQDLYLKGKVKPNIMTTLPLENLAEAFALITGREVRGKVVLTVG
ncbi:MAG: NADPH:quinone oxidoreductase family protein [Pseudorhodoplanes sp.]|uniref:NADPH:quinone oxidoreductase family protein n=1 Tax=Pseudorhodoplanes sp. TaxID=1934341 RepID=UPI003D0DE261